MTRAFFLTPQMAHNAGMTHDTDAQHGAAQADAAARLLRTAATDPHLRAVLGIDGRPVVDASGQRIDTDANTPDDIYAVVLAMRPPADDEHTDAGT